MVSQNEPDSRLSPSSRGGWSSVGGSWIPLVLELYQGLKAFVTRDRHEGLYEMLEHDAVLELADPKGENAVFKKRQRVKFLQNNVIAFQDHAWGVGKILEDYRCSPGVVVDRYQIGDRWNVLVSLRETKNRGDIEEFYIQRRILRGFPKCEEWWQLEMQNQTRCLRLSIIFPKKRPCRRAVLLERTRSRATVLDPGHFAELADGRQILTWEKTKPQRFETYTIKWQW